MLLCHHADKCSGMTLAADDSHGCRATSPRLLCVAALCLCIETRELQCQVAIGTGTRQNLAVTNVACAVVPDGPTDRHVWWLDDRTKRLVEDTVDLRGGQDLLLEYKEGSPVSLTQDQV